MYSLYFTEGFQKVFINSSRVTIHGNSSTCWYNSYLYLHWGRYDTSRFPFPHFGHGDN